MRFRKRVKVFPGFYLNFSNSGISSTVGVKGASINFSKKGTYLNTGIPGTGFHNRHKIEGGQTASHSNYDKNIPNEEKNIREHEILVGEIKSAQTEQLTSASFVELKETLHEVYKDRNELGIEIKQTINEIKSAKTYYVIACIFLVGFFIKSFKEKIAIKEEYLIDLEEQLKNSFVNIDMLFDESYEEKYKILVDSYKKLLTSEIIWDITSSHHQDMKVTRSAASNLVTRASVKFKFDNIDIIKSTFSAFHFENRNGGDLYIYPAFVIVSSNNKEFALIDIKEFELNFLQHRFLEEQKIPSDTKIIDKTWAKVNKNGSPDKRFNDNYEIPIVSYGGIDLKSKLGLNESYSFSNYENSESFAKAFADYQNLLYL